MTSTKTSKPCTHELFTNNFDATKNVNIEELHCKYFDGRFYRFSLSMWKNPILHYQQFMEKPYVTFLNNYLFISHICHQNICSVCFKTLNQLWTSKTYWLLTFFRFRKTNIYSCFFSAWKKLHDMAATFWPLYQLSMRIRDSRLHKNKVTAWFLG